MSRRFLIPALLCSVPFLIQACGSPTATSSGTGGAKTGGTTGSGGVVAGSGGVPAGSGGTTTSSGGTTTGSGGTTAGSGGATTGSGGSTTSSGGTTTATGGARTGGATGSGGTTTATGGTTAGSGGSSTGTGGSTSGTGGARTGGATGSGGASANGGTTAAGTGGATGSGGSTSTTGCDIWVATDGSDTNPGTQSQPVATLQYGYDLLCPPPTGASAGTACSGTLTTLCIKPGTYAIATRFELKKTRMGTASRILTIQGDPTSATRPVLDFSSQPRVACGDNPSDGNLGGITFNADYWALKRVEIKGANDNGIKVQGSHDLVENVAVHGCADCGIQIAAGSGYTNSGTNNTILNSDSYENNDTQCNGANADGFGAKESTGAGNVIRGCRSWDNADDGYDFYGWTSPITLENSWAMSQSKDTGGSKSNGNGFKLGGNSVSAAHILKDLYATDNKYAAVPGNCGFTNNSNPASMSCTGTCASWGNSTQSQNISGVGTSAPGSATAAKMIAAQRNADGTLPAITSL